jgi:hypothetical protein
MQPIVLFNSRGEAGAYLVYPNLFNPAGEWIGFVTAKRDVYSVMGRYVGFLSDDHRILRPRTMMLDKPDLEPPTSPPRSVPPASFPLAPLMSELTHSTIDVLLEEPARLHTLDIGELRPDLE